VRAAFVNGTAQKFLADHDQQQNSQQHLRAAVAALKPSVVAEAKYIGELSAAQGQAKKEQRGSEKVAGMSQLDTLADLYIDSLLLLLDCVESLSSSLKDSKGDAAELERCSKLAEDVLKQLGV
jgi:hypothetical protein